MLLGKVGEVLASVELVILDSGGGVEWLRISWVVGSTVLESCNEVE